jgi:hypothetical protein
MPTRPNRTSGCCRRFAEPKSLTFRPIFGAADGGRRQKLTGSQSLPYKSIGLFGEVAVDALVFEFMGLAMLALCVIVLAIPSSQRPPARRISDH